MCDYFLLSFFLSFLAFQWNTISGTKPPLLFQRDIGWRKLWLTDHYIVRQSRQNLTNISHFQTTIWGIRISDEEMERLIGLTGLAWPIHKGLVRAHYSMERVSASLLIDQSPNNNHGTLVGMPTLVVVILFTWNFLSSCCTSHDERSL